MKWIVMTVLFLLAFWPLVGYGFAKLGDSRDPDNNDVDATAKSVGAFGVAAFFAIIYLGISLLLMLHTVGQREVAIVYNFSGTIAGKKDPGVVTTWPWQHVKKENVGIQHDEWQFGSDNSAVSKDQQEIFALLSVNYQIDNEKVVDLYDRVGPAWKTIIIDSRVPQVFKEVTSTFPTPAITERREELREITRNRLTEELKPYDIKVVDVFIKNLGFSDLYSKSIEEKQKQVQDALRAEAKVKESEALAKQKVAEARGDATANIARAQGEAKANRLRQRSLTPLLVQLEAINKLNPTVQTIICPPGTVCIPNTGVIPTGQNP